MKKVLGFLSPARVAPFLAIVAAGCIGGGETNKPVPQQPGIAQTISFPNPGSQTIGVAPPTLVATASSNLAVTFASQTPSVCTVSGTTITLVAGGPCSITATQPGNAIWAAATPVTDNFAVNSALAPQTISFPQPAAENEGQTATISATASSGLPVTFTSLTTGICTVGGTTVTPIGTGNCIISASQAGNVLYAAATPVQRTITVGAPLVPPTLTFSSGFTNGGLTVDGGGTGGYGGSDQITAGCNGGQFCGGGSAANSSNATSSEYYYIQAPAASTVFQYVGLYVQAPGVTGLSTTGNTPGVQISGQTAMQFTFNQNPEWAAQTSANGGTNILVILTLGNLYIVNSGPCNVKLATVITPTGGAAATTYTVPLSQFTVTQNCAVTTINSPAAALAASGGGPISQVDVQGASGNSALTYNGLTSSANTTVANGGGYFPSTVSLTGPITFFALPSTLTFSSGFTSGAVTVDGGGTGGYGGSDQITAGCNGGQFCGGGSAANSSNATSSEYYYIQAPAASTVFQYVGLYVQAPGVTGLSTTGNTPGVQISGQTEMTFTFNQNPEWAAQTSANGGTNILVILTLGNLYIVNSGPCNVKLATVITPTGGAAATTYTVPLSQFTVTQNCAVTTINSPAAALAASAGGPIAQVDVQGASGNSALTYNGLTSSANTTVANGGGYFPSTVSLTGPITFH